MRELGGKEGAGFSWSSVAKRLGGGRTGKSCRLRYTLELPPRLRHGYFCRHVAVTNVPLLRHRHNPNPNMLHVSDLILPCAMQVVQSTIS